MPPNSAATSLVPSADMAMAFHSCEPGCLERVSMSKLAIAQWQRQSRSRVRLALGPTWRPTPWGWTHRQKARCSEHKTKLLPP